MVGTWKNPFALGINPILINTGKCYCFSFANENKPLKHVKTELIFNESFCPLLITFCSILNDKVPDVAFLQSLLLFDFLCFIYFEYCWYILCLTLLSIYKHVPICFFIKFLGAPKPCKKGDQILLSLENLVLAHFIQSIMKLTFHFATWLLLLCKPPVCTRLCWLKLLYHHQSAYITFCIQRDVCNAAEHFSLLKSKSQFVKVWMNICHSLKPFPTNWETFHPAFGFHIHFTQPLPQPDKWLKFAQQLTIK